MVPAMIIGLKRCGERLEGWRSGYEHPKFSTDSQDSHQTSLCHPAASRPWLPAYVVDHYCVSKDSYLVRQGPRQMHALRPMATAVERILGGWRSTSQSAMPSNNQPASFLIRHLAVTFVMGCLLSDSDDCIGGADGLNTSTCDYRIHAYGIAENVLAGAVDVSIAETLERRSFSRQATSRNGISVPPACFFPRERGSGGKAFVPLQQRLFPDVGALGKNGDRRSIFGCRKDPASLGVVEDRGNRGTHVCDNTEADEFFWGGRGGACPLKGWRMRPRLRKDLTIRRNADAISRNRKRGSGGRTRQLSGSVDPVN
ncbi:hypothetical protein QBC40DRAFT_295540 [Triangularia verruculosa]|uniref:Uncharacterized protein n=1 Tax=Triangularia verruculosa TaxID=2587418 RepID=A0AAN7AY74_9PEZI|nr:hypothetical protein QBC40DRAFT_295540 [Triangularia verruculosa]